MKRLFPLRRHPPGRSPVLHPIAPTCTSHLLVNRLRVRWVLWSSLPLCPSSCHRRGAFAISPHPGVRGFPTVRLRRPIRHCLRHRGFVGGSLPSFPLPLPSCWQLPVFVMEDANGMREVACASRPHPRSAAPQSLSRVRQVDLECQSTTSPCSGPSSGVAPTMSGMTGWHLRQGMPGAPFPVGLDTLHVIHRVIPQPSHHLLRAGLPRMGPFRSMLLTP
jgi:hypothetical protein